MPRGTEEQWIALANGSMKITRNGRHQYRVNDGPLLPSVTAMLGHLSGDLFGIGVNWASKLIRESGDPDAAKKSGMESANIGSRLHSTIDHFIKNNRVDEVSASPLFSVWQEEVGYKSWLASEKFVVNQESGYGGTVDAIALTDEGPVLYDWKTKDATSFEKYGPDLKDQVQCAAYVAAQNSLDTQLGPITVAKIVYVMRDGSKAVTVDVDLKRGLRLFELAHALYKEVRGERE